MVLVLIINWIGELSILDLILLTLLADWLRIKNVCVFDNSFSLVLWGLLNIVELLSKWFLFLFSFGVERTEG